MLRGVLESPRLPMAAALLGAVFVLPSLWGGLVIDDRIHRIVLAYPEVASRLGLPNSGSPTGLFTFFDGNAAQTHRLMDAGVAPWWTCSEVLSSFFRPVAWAAHKLDYWLWPNNPLAMHAHNILWYAAVVFLLARFYRRMMGPTCVAGLAAILYALDETHVIPVGWIANRNALMATFFGLLTLAAHDRWRARNRMAFALLAPISLGLSLLSAEGGAATLAYLGSYALVMDKGTLPKRLATLLPYAPVVVVWRLVWKLMGFGVGAGGLMYVDPLSNPFGFIAAVVERAPTLILGQWALPPADASAFAGDYTVYLLALGIAFAILLAVVVVIPLARRDAVARFWAIGAAVSLLPACSSLPSDRNLMFVGIGAMGLVARYLTTYYDGTIAPGENRGTIDGSDIVRQRVPRVLAPLCGAFAVLFVVVHGVISPIALPIRVAAPLGWDGITRQLHVNLPPEAALDRQDVILVNGPSALHGGYLPIRRANEGLAIPRHTRVLSPSQAAVVITRLDEYALTIRPKSGYLALVYDRLYRDLDHPMALNQRVELTGMTATVTSLIEDGRPAEAEFRFAVPLEDPRLRWLQWRNGGYVPFTPPPIGETVNLPAPIPSVF